MSGLVDRITGRVKKAAGDLADDPELRNQGIQEERKADAKDDQARTVTPEEAVRLGADYLVFAKEWDKKKVGPPQLMGQLFHYFESPNRFGLPAFYTLHVWAWKENPNGAFVNWHPNVSCQAFAGQ